jgi:YesN/AraC family two-component response regulator
MQHFDGQSILAGDILSRPGAAAALAGLREEVLQKTRMLDMPGAENALERFAAALRESAQKNDIRVAWLAQLGLCLMEYAAEQGIGAAENVCWLIAESHDAERSCELLKSYAQDVIREKERLLPKPARHGSLAVEYISQHYMRPNLSVKDMTSQLSVGSCYFSSMFKSFTGMTFTAYLTRLRLEKARDLLTATDQKNYEVAAAVGYDDPGYFRQVFKKHMRLTPSEYRKQHAKKSNIESR